MHKRRPSLGCPRMNRCMHELEGHMRIPRTACTSVQVHFELQTTRLLGNSPTMQDPWGDFVRAVELFI